ncbi:MAG: hypothetical protein QOH88_3146 [Verrucomicrobiota bacterium]
MRKTVRLLFEILLFLSIYHLWRELTKRRSRLPEGSAFPNFDGDRISVPSPVDLNVDSIDDFVDWIAATPVGDAQRIRDQVALAAKDEEVLDALTQNLFDFPIVDLGRHLLLLSIIGELRNPRAAEPLIRFIKLPGATYGLLGSDAGREIRASRQSRDASLLDGSSALQARAVEMLAYLNTPHALQEALKMASDHISRAVRVAAIDAYLFNHGDSAEAAARLKEAIQGEDRKFVGLARRFRGMDVSQFDASIAAFYRNYSAEHPPVPEISANLAKETPSGKRIRRGSSARHI